MASGKKDPPVIDTYVFREEFSGTSPDPYLKARFSVKIPGVGELGAYSISAITRTIDPILYREGHEPPRVRSVRGGIFKDEEITISKAFSNDATLFQWFEDAKNLPLGGIISAKKDVIITPESTRENPTKEYQLIGAWPKTYSVGDFDALSDGVLFESVVLGYDEIKFRQFGGEALTGNISEGS